MTVSSTAEPVYQNYKDQGFQAYIVLLEDATGAPATAELCTAIRDQNGLTMPVLYDPDAVIPYNLNLVGGPANDYSIMIDEGGVLEGKKKGLSKSMLEMEIEMLLSD